MIPLRLRARNPLEQALPGRPRPVPARSISGGVGTASDEGESDGLALCVGAVELADGPVRVFFVGVDHEGGAFGAAGAVVEELELVDGALAAEEVLGVECQRDPSEAPTT